MVVVGLYLLYSLLHTGNLKSNPRASLLFIEDESSSENSHARRRVTYRADVSLISRDDPVWGRVLSQMEVKFGENTPLINR